MTKRGRQGVRRGWGVAVMSLLAALSGVVAYAPPASAAVTDFYVSPSGNDETGSGTAAAPWATIEQARDHIESHGLNDDMSGDIVVHVKAGTYETTETIEFTDADSGTNGHDVIYQADGAVGSAHLVGGKEVTGWSQYAGEIYRAPVDAGADFHTLYENGTRARLARTPNFVYNPKYPTSQGPYLNSEGVAGSSTKLKYKEGDLTPGAWDLAGASVNIWSGSTWDWYTDKTPITSVDTSTRQFTLAQSTRYAIGSGSRYFVQGVLDLLDKPGEFYLDKAGDYLYYYPRFGAVEDQTIVAPEVEQLVSFKGASSTDRAHNIVLDGLTLEMTDFAPAFRHAWPAKNGSGEGHTWADYDRQINMTEHRKGMVFMQNADHITITNSHLTNAGYSAVYMLFDNHDNTVSNSWIDHTGHSGVYLEGPYPGDGDTLNHNTVTNSMINNVGELVGHASGVAVLNSSNNTLSNLEIYNSPRYAVQISAYREPAIPQASIYARDNLVTHVRVHDTTHDSGDTAPIYSWGLRSTAGGPYVQNTWRQLTIDGVYADPSMTDVPPNGIFMDDETYGQIFQNIEITETQGGARRNNGSGEHAWTNVTGVGTFDPASMDYANIGLKASFPYVGAPNFVGDFGNGLTNWTTGKGAASTSTAEQHGGTPSYLQDQDLDVIHAEFSQSQRKTASVWFRDDVSDTHVTAMARVDNDAWDGALWRGMGVDTTKSPSHYVTRLGDTKAVTSIPRSTGWHQLTWDYSSGTGVKMYIDGTLVASDSEVNQFNQISMGDWWSDTHVGTVYWGDVLVSEFADSFENGLTNWTTRKGASTTSTAQAASGSSSLVQEEAMDVVSTSLEGRHRKVASVSFYDNAGDEDLATMARVDNGAWDSSTNWRGLGVDTVKSRDFYVYRVGGTTTATSVARTTGWHKLTWDYRSGDGVKMYIDGVLVATEAGVRYFNQIAMGDWWSDAGVGTVYWDDVRVAAK